MESFRNYINELRNGNKIRIRYTKNIDDYLGGWWSEELWSYNSNDNIFECRYPVSSYEKEFFTKHDDRDIEKVFVEAIRDSIKNNNNGCIKEIIIEGTPVFVSKLREMAIKKIQTMSDDEIRKLFPSL